MSNMYGIIEELCLSKDITIGKMCSLLGISRGTMGDLKAGRTRKLSADNMKKISDFFEVTTDSLLGEEKEKPPVDKDQELADLLEELANREECRMLFQLAKDATPEEVRQAVKVIEALRK